MSSRQAVTRKDVERNGCVCKPYERSMYERTFMSESIENYVIPNEPSNHHLDKKRLQKRHCTFRLPREPSRISIQTLKRLSKKSRKVREFVYKCRCPSTPLSSKCIVFLRLENKLKLKSSETFHKSILKLNLELNDIGHCFLATELCLFTRVKPM